jgi:hypothetical protein
VERERSAAYAARLADRVSPAAREVLDAENRRVERALLEIGLRDGLAVLTLDATRRAVADWSSVPGELAAERLVLTRRGRLPADAVVRDLRP